MRSMISLSQFARFSKIFLHARSAPEFSHDQGAKRTCACTALFLFPISLALLLRWMLEIERTYILRYRGSRLGAGKPGHFMITSVRILSRDTGASHRFAVR